MASKGNKKNAERLRSSDDESDGGSDDGNRFSRKREKGQKGRGRGARDENRGRGASRGGSKPFKEHSLKIGHLHQPYKITDDFFEVYVSGVIECGKVSVC